MNAIRVATWNAEGMFVARSKTRRALPHDAIRTLQKLDADIVFVPEFGTIEDTEESTMNAVHALGYQSVTFAYQQPELGSYGAALFTRLPLKDSTMHSFTNTGRQFIEVMVDLGEKPLRVIGIHFDDRSEELRLPQVDEVLAIVKKSHEPTIVLGDFNAMHKDSSFAKLARSRLATSATKLISHKNIISVAERVREMARGTTIEKMLAGNLHNLDPGHHHTISAKQAGLEWMPALKLAKIDWMLGTSSIHATHYRVMHDVGSDHRPVVATILVKR